MFRVLFLVAVLSFAATCVSAADDDDDTNVVTMGADFKEEVAKNNHLVMFYAPWCGHCKRLHPTWDELSKKFSENEEKDVVIAKVDCTVETAVCSDNDVTGYPTLKFFKKDSEEAAEKYRGGRDLENLVKFINKEMGLEQEKEDLVSEAATADKGLYVLSERSFPGHVAKKDTFVKFYAPWCGHCTKLAPIWDDLASEFESDDSVSVAKIDCTTASALCQEHEVKGYPTLAYFRNGKKIENYRGARNLKEMKDFIVSMKEMKGKASDTADKVPSADAVPAADANAESTVALLTVDNFKDTVKSGVTLVKFFAPWCGHCKRLAPVWEELAAKYEGNDAVTIAKVDCTSDDNKNKELCSEQGVNGFPTLLLFKDGAKVEEFSGKRTTETLQEFVNKHSDAKDKKDEL
jgi:thioredoxin domain-containing protein 5